MANSFPLVGSYGFYPANYGNISTYYEPIFKFEGNNRIIDQGSLVIIAKLT
jgi:hypothetical protein